MKTQKYDAATCRKMMKTGRKYKSHGSFRAQRKPNSPLVKKVTSE